MIEIFPSCFFPLVNDIIVVCSTWDGQKFRCSHADTLIRFFLYSADINDKLSFYPYLYYIIEFDVFFCFIETNYMFNLTNRQD